MINHLWKRDKSKGEFNPSRSQISLKIYLSLVKCLRVHVRDDYFYFAFIYFIFLQF